MQRKRFIAASAILTVGALVLAGCSSSASSDNASPAATTGADESILGLPDLSGQTLTIYTYGGSFADAFMTVVEPFEAATGADVELVTTCCDAFETAVAADQPIGDLVLGNDYGPMKEWSDRGLLLDDDRITEIAEARGIDPAFYQSDLIAVDLYGYVLAWNTAVGDDHPTTWEEFFDTDTFTGSRGLFSNPNSMLEVASLSGGTPGDELYPLDVPADIDTLQKLRDNSDVKFWTDGASLQNMLGTNEIDYAVAFSNRVIQGMQEGLPIDASFDQALVTASGAAIPKNAKNVDAAVAFLDFYLQPEQQAAFAEISALAPAYPSANELIDPEMLPYMVTAPDNIESSIPIDDNWWAENNQEASDLYAAWMNG